jgi:hypothetical protein
MTPLLHYSMLAAQLQNIASARHCLLQHRLLWTNGLCIAALVHHTHSHPLL